MRLSRPSAQNVMTPSSISWWSLTSCFLFCLILTFEANITQQGTAHNLLNKNLDIKFSYRLQFYVWMWLMTLSMQFIPNAGPDVNTRRNLTWRCELKGKIVPAHLRQLSLTGSNRLRHVTICIVDRQNVTVTKWKVNTETPPPHTSHLTPHTWSPVSTIQSLKSLVNC